ncbi:MATE family efflux transporter [Bacillus alkalicellulosilyticus]|uniref:MATE family efflux transporter n=1 Tax=Alkalihalobacterium alkalicellulosilyticum TaxID=1912214 RepID=UPI000996DDAC|nr:MATE family efflux transporter [Bacillus alkalicellulosilyticus]
MKPENKKNVKNLSLFALTWPIFIEISLHMLMGSADTLMLSQYSDDGVAAVGVATQILSLIIVMFGFIATGTSVLIAQYMGAGREEDAAKIAVVSLVANLAFSLVLGLIIALGSTTILNLMQIPVELMDMAMIYLIIVGGTSFTQAVLMTAGAIIRSHGFTKDAMYVTIGMNIINVVGNYLFLFGPFGIPVLGVTGVAIATAVSRILGLILLMILLYKRVNGNLPFSYLKHHPKRELGNLLKIGIPSAGEHLSYNTAQLMITFFVAMLGTEALTTKVYAQNLTFFVSLFAFALSQSNQIIIGHQIGANKIKEAYHRCLRSLYIAFTVSALTAGVFALFKDQLLGIFTDNLEIIALGGILMLLTIILEPGRAFNVIIINSLRAAGDVKFPVYMGILIMWGVGVPVAYIFGIHFELGLIGVWIAFIVDEWVRGVIMLLRWRSKKWQKMSFVRSDEAAS